MARPGRSGDSGFCDTIKAFVKGAMAFAKTVLLVQGDDHEFYVDQPLTTDLEDGETLENVYRLRVMGKREIQAVRGSGSTRETRWCSPSGR